MMYIPNDISIISMYINGRYCVCVCVKYWYIWQIFCEALTVLLPSDLIVICGTMAINSNDIDDCSSTSIYDICNDDRNGYW